MATDLATLGIKIESGDIKKAVRDLNKLEKQGKKTEKANKKLNKSNEMLSKSFGRLKGVVAGYIALSTVQSVVKTAAAFEKLEASLITVTGSTENATKAMEGIKAFATSTPFQVQEITDSFIKLKALGIQPTEANLRSFGNTSSAMGKSLNQMIEAVADAATGEFERLKEFGIKASSQGDRVKFTFQGVTTEIGKNSDEITKYLREIGETKFGDAMERQMDTLDGAFSNFGDTVDNAVSKLAKESGFNSLIKAATLGVSQFIRELTGTENAGDFKEKIAELNKEIAATQKIIDHNKGREEKGWLNNLFYGSSEDNIDKYTEKLVSLKAEVAGLEAQLTDAENKKNGLDAVAGGSSGGAPTIEGFGFGKELEDIQSKYTEESLLLQEKYDNEALIISEAYNHGEIKLDEHNEKLRMSEEEYELKRVELKKKTTQQKLDIELAGAKTSAAIADKFAILMTAKNKDLFEIGKVAATASALINTYEGATKALAQGGFFGIAMAAAVITAGMVQISNIQSQQFGGGGGGGGGGAAPSISLGGGSVPDSRPISDVSALEQPQQKTQQVSITLNGAGYSRENVRELIESINEEIGDGANLVTA